MAHSADRNGDNRDPLEPKEKKAIEKRLSRLGKRLGSAKARRGAEVDPSQRGAAIGLAFRLATELVVGVIVGVFIGWWLDKWLGTSPVLLLIFTFLGLAAGTLNVIRTAKQMQGLDTDALNREVQDRQDREVQGQEPPAQPAVKKGED